MDGKKEWFTLQETAALLERTGPNGQLLTGYEAEQAVLKLVFEESDGERFPLIPAVRFDSHILIKRYLSRLDRNSEGHASLDYGAKIKGYWPCAGFPRKRFRYLVPPPPYCVHPFQVTTAPENPVEFTGLLNLWLYGQPRRIDGKIILDKSGIDPAAAFPHSGILWYDPAFHEYPKVQVMAFEKVVVEGIEHRPTCKTINENELVITRRSLTRYAADHGYINTLRLIAGDTGSEQATGLNIVDVPVKSLVVPLAPPAEEVVEQHAEKEEGPILSELGLMNHKAKTTLLGEYADYHSKKGKHRRLIAVELKEAGATSAFIGRLWGASRTGEDKSAASKRGIKLVKEGLEMRKKMKVKS